MPAGCCYVQVMSVYSGKHVGTVGREGLGMDLAHILSYWSFFLPKLSVHWGIDHDSLVRAMWLVV